MAEGNGNGQRGRLVVPEISLGNLLSIIAMAAAVFLSYTRINTDIAVIKVEIDHVKASVRTLERRIDGRRSLMVDEPDTMLP